jgi:acylphosphatase
VIRRRLVIHGRDQGVYFRDSLRRRALQANVAGWARNNRDGTVEAVLEGEEGAVDRLVAFCHDRPRGATVDRVEVHSEAPENLQGFAVH